MKKRKFLVGILFLSAVVLGTSATSISVLAQETSNEYEELMVNEYMQEGDEYVLGELGGETIYVEVIDDYNTKSTRSALTNSSKSFVFYKNNIAGVKEKILIVTSSCYWLFGEKITSLDCIYTKYDSLLTCSWSDYTFESDTYYMKTLEMSYLGDYRSVIFGAHLNENRMSLTLDCL